MNRRSFIGRLGAVIAAIPLFRAVRASADDTPKTLGDLIRRVEALWPEVRDMAPRAFEEAALCNTRVHHSEWPVYRLVPVTLAMKADGQGPEVEQKLIAWLWKQFKSAAHEPRFADGTLYWRKRPELVTWRAFDSDTVETRIRCRAGVIPKPVWWTTTASEVQPFAGKPEGAPAPRLA